MGDYCAFQYATERGMVKDLRAITRAEAEAIWKNHIQIFKRAVENSESPEMAIWVNMEHDSDFHTKSAHWHAAEMFIENGTMYMKTAVA